MRTLLNIAMLAVLLTGCRLFQSRTAYNSLYTTQVTTTSAVMGYYDLVVKGQVRTNGVPAVSSAYITFNNVFQIALSAAQYQTNAPASVDVVNASASVLSTISKAKEVK